MSRRQLPQGWATARVGELAECVQYGTSAKAETERGTIPVLRMGNLQDGKIVLDNLKYLPADHREFPGLFLSPGDVLFNRTNSIELVGKTAVYKSEVVPCSFASYLLRLRLCPAYNPDLLSAYLNSPPGREWVRSVANQQVGQANVNGAKLKALEVPVPPRAEQDRIVREIETQFSRLDVGIEALRRLQVHVKRYRAAVLTAACEGKLVPTEAELARKEGRDYEPADKLLERILKARRAKWENNQLAKMKAAGKTPKDANWKTKYQEPAAPAVEGLPALPEGWAWTSFELVSQRVTVGHVGPMKSEYVAAGIPFLRSQNVRENRYDPTGLLYISPEFHAKLEKSVLHPGDIVVVRSGAVGVACVIPDAVGAANCSDLVVIQKPLGLEPRYGAYFLNSRAKQAIREGQVGIALTHFNTKSVAALAVALPPLAEQQRIVAETDDRLSVVDAAERAIAANLKRASRLRQSILKHAFEGKVVPQDPADEPASVLLERICANAADAPEKPVKSRSPRSKSKAVEA